ncbi:hypothetical protein JCM15765_13160 [Paradesulfitobacterium aromaticivorans]
MSDLDKHARLFNRIAPIYNWFFQYQVKHYRETLKKFLPYLHLPRGGRVLDLGCGTGAFLYCFAELGFDTTGVDIAPSMIRQAQKSTSRFEIEFALGDATQGLPFADKFFDLVYSSYVAHGVKEDLRRRIYAEASRISHGLVLFHDYYPQRELLTDIVEWAEGGDYFNFIRYGEQEMREEFAQVETIRVGPHSAWYVCTPSNQAKTSFSVMG